MPRNNWNGENNTARRFKSIRRTVECWLKRDLKGDATRRHATRDSTLVTEQLCRYIHVRYLDEALGDR